MSFEPLTPEELARRLYFGQPIPQIPINWVPPAPERRAVKHQWQPPAAWQNEPSGIAALIRQALRESDGEVDAAARLLADSTWTRRWAGALELDVLVRYTEELISKPRGLQPTDDLKPKKR
jgi:hypothetical protein